MTDSTTFTFAEALAVQKALAKEAGVDPALFLMHRFIGSLSEEIEALRAQGCSAEDIAAIIRKATNKPVSAGDVDEHYIPPEERR